MNKFVTTRQLANGLTVLVRPTKTIPKVSMQLFYRVGSKDEKSGERGIAHLLEHMIFKGTESMTESDINMITHKLSGTTNAFTSYDYTGYEFDLPTQHWTTGLRMFADCMQNCRFDQEMLNSEMKAVIQELKMYNDDYESTLIEKMISTIFYDHPYHFPIIGFKQDLWSVQSEDLKRFYKKHYAPNNAALVVVGDVDPEEVFKEAEHYFAAIQPNLMLQSESYYHGHDTVAKQVTVYRDVEQPICAIAFEVPGSRALKDHVIEVLSWVLTHGQSSRLHKKLVDELQLVTSIQGVHYDLFDQGLFFLMYHPKDGVSTEKINQVIADELRALMDHGIESHEVSRAVKQMQADTLAMLENNHKQAYCIGKYYLASGDPEYIFTYTNIDEATIQDEVQQLVRQHCSSVVMHTGQVLALRPEDEALWKQVQEQSDQEDARILVRAVRSTEIEPGKLVHSIEKKSPKAFAYPKPIITQMDNGLKLMHYHNATVPKVHIALNLAAKHYYDPAELEGLYNFITQMIYEGTEHYTKEQLARAFEERGMSLSIKPGIIELECLSQDLPQALELLRELIDKATMPQSEISKVQDRIIAAQKSYWDEPTKVASHVARKTLYKNHPYASFMLGTADTLKGMTQEVAHDAYRTWFTPQGAQLVIVGDLKDYNVPALVADYFSDWHGSAVVQPQFPEVAALTRGVIHERMNRDQVVLGYLGKSIKRSDPAFDSLLLFDQIFTGGALGSMSSRLFALREQSGLFYTIGGSLLYNVDEQPGMVYIRTIVSQDRLQEAESAIEGTIAAAADTITGHEFDQAKDAIINSLVDHFESNRSIAYAFLFMDRYKLPFTYFDTRAQQLEAVTLQEMASATQTTLHNDRLMKVRVGRAS